VIRFGLYYFVYFANFAVIAPYFQTFLYSRGFDESDVGLLLGCFGLAGAAGAIGVGHLADLLGKRRPLLLAAMLGSIALMAPLNWIDSIWLAAPVIILFGVAYKATIPLADALAGAELPKPTVQYGRARALGSLGFVVGVWVFYLFDLLDESDPTSIFLCFVGAGALSIPVICLLPDSHRRDATYAHGSDGVGSFDRAFWLFLTIVFLGQLGMSAFYSFFSLYLRNELQLASPGRIWTIGATAEIPFIFFAGYIIRRYGVVRMMAVSLSAMAVRLALYGTFPSLGAIIAITMLHGFTFGLTHTATIEFIRLKIPRRRQGLAMTLYMSIGLGLAQMIGSTASGYITEYAGYRAMFYAHAAAPVVGLVLLGLGRHKLAVA